MIFLSIFRYKLESEEGLKKTMKNIRNFGTSRTWVVTVSAVAIMLCAVGLIYAVTVFFGQAGRDMRVSKDELALNSVNSSVNSEISTIHEYIDSNFTNIYISIADILTALNASNSTFSNFFDLSDYFYSQLDSINSQLNSSVKSINSFSPDETGLFTITGTNGITTGAGATSNELYISLENSTVTADEYPYATVTVDHQGRISSAVNNLPTIDDMQTKIMALMLAVDMLNMTTIQINSHDLDAFNTTLSSLVSNVMYLLSVGATVRNVTVGTGLETVGGLPITTTGTIKLADTLVTPGDYTFATISVDQQGRLTFAESGVPTLAIHHQGTPLSTAQTLNFAGSGVSVAAVGATTTVTIPGTITIQGDSANILTFTGAGVSAITSSGTTTVTIDGGSGTGTVTSVTGGAGLSGGVITTSGTLSLSTFGLGSASYAQPSSITVDAYGRVSSVVAGINPYSVGSTLTPGIMDGVEYQIVNKIFPFSDDSYIERSSLFRANGAAIGSTITYELGNFPPFTNGFGYEVLIDYDATVYWYDFSGALKGVQVRKGYILFQCNANGVSCSRVNTGGASYTVGAGAGATTVDIYNDGSTAEIYAYPTLAASGPIGFKYYHAGGSGATTRFVEIHMTVKATRIPNVNF